VQAVSSKLTVQKQEKLIVMPEDVCLKNIRIWMVEGDTSLSVTAAETVADLIIS